MTVTNHMVRKILATVNRESRAGVRGVSTKGTATMEEEVQQLSLLEKKIVRVQSDKYITSDGLKCKLYLPVPSLELNCLGVSISSGLITLEKPLDALVISDGTNHYVLGFKGATDEFEQRIINGDTKIHINNEYISRQSKHHIKDGVEEQ